MSVTERERHELYVVFEELIGSERASTMMSMLPPVGWADVATKSDLAHLEARLDLRFESLEHGLEAKFERSMRQQLRVLMFGLVTSLAALTTLNLTVVTVLN